MASQKIVEAKATVVDEITEVAKNNASFILFDYRGLTAEETSELRKILRESDSKYRSLFFRFLFSSDSRQYVASAMER